MTIGHACTCSMVAVNSFVSVLGQARALVFDFDGTLVDSNPIKEQAFEACFAEFPERYSRILSYYQSSGHTSRGDKFRHVYEEILGLPYTPAVAVMLHERFAAATTYQIIKALEIPGATEFLLAAKHRYIMALLSSTPHETLLHILSERGWRDYFEVVKGAPVDKSVWIREFCLARKLGQQKVVCFGDSVEDFAAAQAAGCTFVGVANGVLGTECSHYINDFNDLLAALTGTH